MREHFQLQRSISSTVAITSRHIFMGNPGSISQYLSTGCRVFLYRHFRFNEFALRLPSALSLSLWGIALFYFLLGTTNIKVSLFALLILTTNVACIGISRFASADGLLNLFIALSFFDMYRYWEARNKRVVYRVFLWISLGVLTKGPIAILVPLVSGFVFSLYKKISNSF